MSPSTPTAGLPSASRFLLAINGAVSSAGEPVVWKSITLSR